MNKNELLNELAMKMAEWPKSILVDVGFITTYWTLAIGPSGIVFIQPSLNGVITESDWFQRRMELIDEPDDANAPKWANWKCQDSFGRWEWYAHRPTAHEKVWHSPTGYCESRTYGEIPAGHDWRKTLREVRKVIRVGAAHVYETALKGGWMPGSTWSQRNRDIIIDMVARDIAKGGCASKALKAQLFSSQPKVDGSNCPESPDSSKPGIDSAVCLLQNRRDEISAELNKINAALNALGVADDSQKQTD